MNRFGEFLLAAILIFGVLCAMALVGTLTFELILYAVDPSVVPCTESIVDSPYKSCVSPAHLVYETGDWICRCPALEAR